MFIVYIVILLILVGVYFEYIKPRLTSPKKTLLEKNELVFVSDTLNSDDDIWCLRVFQGIADNGLIKCKYSPETDVVSYWKYCIKFEDYKPTDNKYLPNKKIIVNMDGELIYLYS